MAGRTTPYTEIGVRRVKCFRCGAPSRYQWQVCADNRYFRAICAECDILLNELVLTWMGDPDVAAKMEAYRNHVHGL